MALSAGCSLSDPSYLSEDVAGSRALAGASGQTSHAPSSYAGVGGLAGLSGGSATLNDGGRAVDGGGSAGAPTGVGGSLAAEGGADGSAEGGAFGSGEASGGAGADEGISGAAGAPGNGAVSTPDRPLLSARDAQKYTVPKYLAQAGTLGSLVKDDWDPTAGLGDTSELTPTFTVAADGSGTHTTVQEALDDAALGDGPSRIYIAVEPGTYRELVCASGSIPVTLYGLGTDPDDVKIVYDNFSRQARDDDINPCVPTSPEDSTYGLRGSATFAADADELQITNLSIVNDFDESTVAADGDLSAVALLTRGDRVVLENVRITGNQYVAFFDTPDPSIVSRVYVKDSYIEGDMQYITGRGTVVIDHSEIHFLPARLGASMGSLYAMSTAAQNEYGLLIIDTRFTTEPTSYSGWVLLGRAWDEDVTTYEPGVSPNGQAVIRDCFLDSHIKKFKPYGNALVTVRLFDSEQNRLYEYANTGPGAAE